MKIKTNPDTDFVKEMKKELKKNNGYCPCSPMKNKDTKCMCKNFREQTEAGYCHCGLYYKE
jgi:ferredoxin-thioredoxin reductase catalytic subunit